MLPTGDAGDVVEVAVAADDGGEPDDELVRLQKLLGMAGAAKEAVAVDDAEEPVTIDLEAAAEELEGSAKDEDEEEN